MIVWGWGQGPGRSALNPTNRAFLWDPFNAHSGLQANDPSTLDDPDGDGVSEPTLAGAIQFPATHRAPDAGNSVDPLGFSTDDPDGDGYLNEISEGDLDLGEWFMLNAPRPAFAGTNGELIQGIQLMNTLNCASCHTPAWRIKPKHGDYAGDRRFFDLKTRWSPQRNRLEGRVVKLYRERGGRYERRFRSATVVGIFSDLAHHDMGEGFRETGYDGVSNTVWRTPPLWGVGSGFPWGHDGASLTLEDSILRHTGEGEPARQAWLAADQDTKDELLAFLRKLQLYDIESLPTDMDGNHRISSSFGVAGMDTGEERFNPEWLFETPVRIQGMVQNYEGGHVRSFAATNLDAAYGQDLPYRIDSDDDGWADVWDNAPLMPGYKDGVD